MYKLLLVSDQEEILNAFDQIKSWEMLGFKKPHIRHDFEGMKDSLQKHHADGIAIAVSSREEKEKIFPFLRERYPNLSIFEPGRNEEEIRFYLSELNTVLNRVRADFSNDNFHSLDMLQACRHEFFRHVLNGEIKTKFDLLRWMHLLRSRMDPKRPCFLARMGHPSEEKLLEEQWLYGPEPLDKALRNSFGGDRFGLHILPSVVQDGSVMVLACPLVGFRLEDSEEKLREEIREYLLEGIEHISQYFGLELKLESLETLPSLAALCKESSKALESD